MVETANETDLTTIREQINHAYRMDETQCVDNLLACADLGEASFVENDRCARELVTEIRQQRIKKSSLDAFLYEYDLSSEEGVALMCLAEAMLRVPDAATADDLIRDKITSADWEANLGRSESFFVNASTWALMLTGKIVSEPSSNNLSNALRSLVRRSSEPFIRKAVSHAMKVLGKQFVMGRTIKEALRRAKDFNKAYRFSYDMLGEAARTQADAEKYYQDYSHAINELAKAAKYQELMDNPGISIKLSALHPRYEFNKHDQIVKELSPLLLSLAMQAKSAGISLTVDAEEARLLELSFDVFTKVYTDPGLEGWEGLGLALQSYQKRAWYVIDWIGALYQQHGRRIPVRLIKGAYWDSEVKYAQTQGLDGYPVFTRKSSTDVSFIACAKKMFSFSDAIYPQFGSHNAFSVATILSLAKAHKVKFEFQCLHGMGQALYDLVTQKYQVPCRIYAPVGNHKVLLSYLVRRLLENGANTSFVNRLADVKVPLDEVVANPVQRTKTLVNKPHPKIPLPSELYGKDRLNSAGRDFSDPCVVEQLQTASAGYQEKTWHAASLVAGKLIKTTDMQTLYSPADDKVIVGQVNQADEVHIAEALANASNAFPDWSRVSVEKRAQHLLVAADLLEKHSEELLILLNKEAGKTFFDAEAELREAVDFCRYYAEQASKNLQTLSLPGPTGELNQLSYTGRGPIVCISPWNFPLAIFLGQISAALVAGNTVIAKPAEQTPMVAFRAVQLLHEAGIPGEVLQLLLGPGEAVGARLVQDERVKGVMFTGSTQTARLINQTLANRQGAIVPLIAETGGQNAMIVDSTALFEQVVSDVLLSAFGSAGQRCSALRVLYLQDDIADEFIEMLKGAMAELSIGDPALLATDIGPLIDEEALNGLEQHLLDMDRLKEAKLIYQTPLNKRCQCGHFFAPCAVEIDTIARLKGETFGPFLHIVRFKLSKLSKVIEEIQATGFGLTQGVHSRIGERVNEMVQRFSAGNIYVNRNMIGAVVGVQPFGGHGLSGTGPKAGGPNYLFRLVNEKTLTVDTTASGGNATLLTLTEDD